MGCLPPWHCKKPSIKLHYWWLSQPIWKIYSSNLIISPRIGAKIKNIWNHHLENVNSRSFPLKHLFNIVLVFNPIKNTVNNIWNHHQTSPTWPQNIPRLKHMLNRIPRNTWLSSTQTTFGIHQGISWHQSPTKWGALCKAPMLYQVGRKSLAVQFTTRFLWLRNRNYMKLLHLNWTTVDAWKPCTTCYETF